MHVGEHGERAEVQAGSAGEGDAGGRRDRGRGQGYAARRGTGAGAGVQLGDQGLRGGVRQGGSRSADRVVLRGWHKGTHLRGQHVQGPIWRRQLAQLDACRKGPTGQSVRMAAEPGSTDPEACAARTQRSIATCRVTGMFTHVEPKNEWCTHAPLSGAPTPANPTSTQSFHTPLTAN